MAEWPESRIDQRGLGTSALNPGAIDYDRGLRAYMLGVYNYMASGVLLTGIVALTFAIMGWTAALVTSGLFIIAVLSPLAIVFAMSFGARRMSDGTMTALYWLFAFLMGVSMSTLFLRYDVGAIGFTFVSTAAAFAGLSLYGYTTKRDLSPIGTFLIMGVVGLIAAMIINMFVPSSGLYWIINVIGIMIFAGLTAYDTQKIKSMYFGVRGSALAGKSAVLGALQLYLDFVNLFQFLLALQGGGRR